MGLIALAGATTVGCTSVQPSTKPWGPAPAATASSTAPETTAAYGAISTVPPAKPGQPTEPLEPRTTFAGADQCQAKAQGPWQPVAYGTDPVAAVRDGHVPQYNRDHPLTVREFPTLESYDDPSTMDDAPAVYGAFEAAGYEEGIEGSYRNGGEETTVSVVRFHDATGARAAVSAHLADYCRRATSGYVNPDGTGLIVLRQSGTVRNLYVLGDAEVSVLVCECFGDNGEEREGLVESWSSDVNDYLRQPPPESKPV